MTGDARSARRRPVPGSGRTARGGAGRLTIAVIPPSSRPPTGTPTPSLRAPSPRRLPARRTGGTAPRLPIVRVTLTPQECAVAVTSPADAASPDAGSARLSGSPASPRGRDSPARSDLPGRPARGDLRPPLLATSGTAQGSAGMDATDRSPGSARHRSSTARRTHGVHPPLCSPSCGIPSVCSASGSAGTWGAQPGSGGQRPDEHGEDRYRGARR